MDVLTAAWIGDGRPTVEPSPTLEGPCARCGTTAALVPARSVISKAFTAFDGWSTPNGRGLCPACAWCYDTTSLRAVAHLVTRQLPALRRMTRDDAVVLLRAGALAVDLSLVVPLRPGRKHVVPAAEWGRVSVDDVPVPWSASDAQLLEAVLELRSQGFGTRMLAEPAPPVPVLKALAPDRWARVLQLWEALGPWRTPDSPWMDLALHITTPTSTKENR